jgi:hypothetical protein
MDSRQKSEIRNGDGWLMFLAYDDEDWETLAFS